MCGVEGVQAFYIFFLRDGQVVEIADDPTAQAQTAGLPLRIRRLSMDAEALKKFRYISFIPIAKSDR